MLRLSQVGPVATVTLYAEVPARSTPVCAPCNVPNTAPGGVVTRRVLQIYASILAHGRREIRSEVHRVACTLSHEGGTRRRVDATQRSPLTGALVRNTRTHKGRKNNEPRGVHPFVISNVVRTATRSRAALPSHNVQSCLSSPMT